ncbi:MAG: FkbM family methyltransferase [Xanthomonadales bacterium]|nr:FkbM family methyltransferase [Xanthomonadales bacterium]
MKAYILTKLAVFSLVKESVFPRAAEHLDYAKRQWKHPYLRTHFRARNQCERELIFDSVALWDEYGVEQMDFAPADVILDIGAHVGIFSYMCHLRGSRAIFAYEPEAQNFERLTQHLRDLEGIALLNLAVFRSDQLATTAPTTLLHSGYLGANTGGGNVVLRGALVEIVTQELNQSPPSPQRVETIALDEILKKFERVRLLKLDCEASEFPILLTSQLLDRVDQITGEYHEISPPVYAMLDPAAQIENFSEYRFEQLVTRLEQFGFQVNVKPAHPYIGKFVATRNPDSLTCHDMSC